MQLTRDSWVTAQVICQHVKGDGVSSSSATVFKRDIACKPNFPKPSKFGKTDVWNWGEVSDYFFSVRDTQKVGRPRKK